MPGVLPVTYTQPLSVIQSGQEAVWGTAVARTAKWMAVADFPSFTPMVKGKVPKEDRGSLQNSHYSFLTKNGGEFTINWEYCTFEEILFPAMSTLQAVAPTGGSPYVWTFLGENNAVNALQPYTLEWQYDILTGLYKGCIGKKMTLSGDAENEWKVGMAGFFQQYDPYLALNIESSTNASPIAITVTGHPYATGDQVVITGHLVNTNANGTWTIIKTGANTFTLTGSTGNGVGVATGTVDKIQTPALADRTVEAAIFGGTTLSIEAAGGTPGTTPVNNSLLSFSCELENNVNPIWTNNALYPTVTGYNRMKATLKMRLLFNAQIKNLLETTLINSKRAVIQLKYTSGSKIIELDYAGVLTADPKRPGGQQQGASYVDIELENQYDTGALANSLKLQVTNLVSALP